MSTNPFRIHIIGVGHLGTAIVQGLLSSGLAPTQILFSEHSIDRQALLKKELSIELYSKGPVDVTLLCIKPQQVSSFELPKDYQSKLLVSVMAGVTIDALQALAPNIPIARAMPNLAAFYRASATCIYLPSSAKKHVSVLNVLFKRIGHVIWLDDEEELNLATAIVGSGPAFFLELIKNIHDLAPDKKTHEMIRYSLQSALALANDPEDNLDDIINAITSPGGTTEAGLKLINQHKVGNHLQKAFVMAAKKSSTLHSRKAK